MLTQRATVLFPYKTAVIARVKLAEMHMLVEIRVREKIPPMREKLSSPR